jgi:hypothetical protein
MKPNLIEGNRWKQVRAFLKKSAAKNFCELAALRDAARRPIRKSFLLLFFKKEALSYFSSRTGKPAASGINEPAWT